MSSNETLKNRYKHKELRLRPIKTKIDLIGKVVSVINSTLSDDIQDVLEFQFSFDSTLLLSDSNFYIYYKSFETNEERKEKEIKEDVERQKKLKLLSRLAEELNYKLEKIND